MDIWHRLGRVIRISNLGTLIFFLLNISLILLVFCPNGITWQNALPLIAIYFITVLISFSPVGEWLLATMAGAREIKRTDIKIKLIPLLEVVFNEAKAKVPSMVSSVHLKIVHDESPNAFAIGRKTICVTDGLLNLSDEEIMAVFAHELGHLAYHHTSIQLLIGGGNLFISGCLLLIKLSCWLITALFSIFAIGTRRLGRGLIIAAIGSISSISIWLWTKFCMLFLMWSMRQNEYVADEFAYKLGYGNILASILDRQMVSKPQNGLLKALYATHPHSDDRIARLQQLGATYSRY